MAETKPLNMALSKFDSDFDKNETSRLNKLNTKQLPKQPSSNFNNTQKLHPTNQVKPQPKVTSAKKSSKNKVEARKKTEINPNKILKDARERAKNKPKNKVVTGAHKNNKSNQPKFDANGRKQINTSFVKRDILGNVDQDKIPKSHTIDASKKSNNFKGMPATKKAPEVSEMSAFYESIIEKITGLYKANKKDDALKIIREELDQPYMPLEYLELFEQLALKIESETKQENYIKRFNNMSKLELLDKFYSPENHTCDVFLFQYFLNKYRSELKLPDMLYIQDVFLDKIMRNEDKLFLIEHLNQFKISYDFKFYNSYTSESSTINPRNHLLPDKIPLFTESLKLINKKCFNDPSLQSLIVDLMYIMYSYFYPEPPDFTIDNFTFTLIDYAKALLTGSGYRDNEITLILQRALKGIKND